MSPLALAVYSVLRRLVPCQSDPRISYADLLNRLPQEFQHLDLENPSDRNQVWTALGEIVVACRDRGLPALSAIVVHLVQGQLEYPGTGYYPLAHPGVSDAEQLLVLWGHELESVRQTTYPQRIDSSRFVLDTLDGISIGGVPILEYGKKKEENGGTAVSASPTQVVTPFADPLQLADEVVRLLGTEIQHLPEGFLDSFAYNTTGNNLAHPIMLGTIARLLWGIPGVHFVGVDVRLNLGGGVRFQPDLVAFDKDFGCLMFLDHESPNSSDARVPTKDVDAYIAWREKSGLAVPYLIVTTLPDGENPSWELRWTSAGHYNEAFHGKWEKMAANPFRFWYGHYSKEFAKRKMDGVALINLDGTRVSRAFPR